MALRIYYKLKRTQRRLRAGILSKRNINLIYKTARQVPQPALRTALLKIIAHQT